MNAVVVNSRNAGSRSTAAPAPRSRRNRFRSRSRSRSPLSPRTGLDTSRHREPGSSGGDHDAAVFPRIPSHRIHNDHRVGRVGEDDVARVHFRDFCGIPPSPLLVGRSSGGDATQSIPRTSRTSRTRRMPRRIGYDNVRHGDELFPAVWNGECVLNPGQPPPGYRLGWVPI